MSSHHVSNQVLQEAEQLFYASSFLPWHNRYPWDFIVSMHELLCKTQEITHKKEKTWKKLKNHYQTLESKKRLSPYNAFITELKYIATQKPFSPFASSILGAINYNALTWLNSQRRAPLPDIVINTIASLFKHHLQGTLDIRECLPEIWIAWSTYNPSKKPTWVSVIQCLGNSNITSGVHWISKPLTDIPTLAPLQKPSTLTAPTLLNLDSTSPNIDRLRLLTSSQIYSKKKLQGIIHAYLEGMCQ